MTKVAPDGFCLMRSFMVNKTQDILYAKTEDEGGYKVIKLIIDFFDQEDV